MRSMWILGAALLAGPAFAADVVALSPADREAAIDAAPAKDSDLPINGNSRKIHGEMGVAIGSNGYHALYGSTVVPIGDTGTAAFSFYQGQYGNRRR